MHNKESTFLYCNQCRITTPHAIEGNTHTCKRCGAVKTTERVRHRTPESGRPSNASECQGTWN